MHRPLSFSQVVRGHAVAGHSCHMLQASIVQYLSRCQSAGTVWTDALTEWFRRADTAPILQDRKGKNCHGKPLMTISCVALPWNQQGKGIYYKGQQRIITWPRWQCWHFCQMRNGLWLVAVAGPQALLSLPPSSPASGRCNLVAPCVAESCQPVADHGSRFRCWKD